MTDAILPLRDASLTLEPVNGGRAQVGALEETPVRLIYIAGYGRSGTTLLDIALGGHPAVMGAGEVTTLARHVWDNAEYCACGQTVRDCPSWGRIVGRWTEGEGSDLLSGYRQAQERTEGLVGMARRLRLRGWQEHARRTLKLFRTMANVSGAPILVDSSKLPGRAFALATMPGIELTVVHVVRDGRGVGWSLLKGYERNVRDGVQRELRPKPLLYTALRWTMVNLAAERLCRRVGPSRSVRVRYEDFVDDPGGVISQILALVGERPPLGIAEPMVLEPQHQVAGSRHRMQKSIAMRRDDKWKQEMPMAKQWLFTILCAPMLRRYGYSLHPARETLS